MKHIKINTTYRNVSYSTNIIIIFLNFIAFVVVVLLISSSYFTLSINQEKHSKTGDQLNPVKRDVCIYCYVYFLSGMFFQQISTDSPALLEHLLNIIFQYRKRCSRWLIGTLSMAYLHLHISPDHYLK